MAHSGRHQAASVSARTTHSSLLLALIFYLFFFLHNPQGKSRFQCFCLYKLTCKMDVQECASTFQNSHMLLIYYDGQFSYIYSLRNPSECGVDAQPGSTCKIINKTNLKKRGMGSLQICVISAKINIMFVLSCLIPTQKIFSVEVVRKSCHSQVH